MSTRSQSSRSRGSKTFGDEDQEEKVGFLGGGTKRWRTESRRFALLNTCWTIFNVVFFSASLIILFSSQNFGRNWLLKKTSAYSPVLDKVDIAARIKQIDAGFFPSANPSVGRQEPTPKADAIWEEWELARTIPVTGEDVRKMGKDPSIVAKLNDEVWHLGDDAYMATFDIFHQLHCLNTLRKLIYPGYYNYTSAHIKHPALWNLHLNHCVDILMQNIQCSGNTALVPMLWQETQDIPFPDFGINRQCNDFDTLVDWRKEKSINMDKYVTVVKKPEGVRQALQDEAYFAIYGEQDREGSISPPPK